MTLDLLVLISGYFRAMASDFAEGSDEHETFTDAADAVDDAKDLLEGLIG